MASFVMMYFSYKHVTYKNSVIVWKIKIIMNFNMLIFKENRAECVANRQATMKNPVDIYIFVLGFATHTYVAFWQNASIIRLSCFEKLILYLKREYILRNTGINKMAAMTRR
jgi:hypothetical protein